MTRLFDKYRKGIKAGHHKNTRNFAAEIMPVPDFVSISMGQHMGPPCDVLVKPRDEVRAGQVIGDSGAFLSAPVHSSVSGTVERIDELMMPNGARVKIVAIKTDKLQTYAEDLTPPQINSRTNFVAAVRASGVVGLGGADFPTHIKLNLKGGIDCLVINAAECEPYITSDYRTLIEDSGDALDGIRTVMRYLDIPSCVTGIEDNKPQAITLWNKSVGDLPNVHVKSLKSKYPQGAEKCSYTKPQAASCRRGSRPPTSA